MNIEEEMFLPSERLLQEALTIYDRYLIPSSIQGESLIIKMVFERKIERWCEPFNRFPQSIFTFWYDGICLGKHLFF